MHLDTELVRINRENQTKRCAHPETYKLMNYAHSRAPLSLNLFSARCRSTFCRLDPMSFDFILA